MNTPGQDDPIARRAREVFDAASGDIDPTTAGRLRLARRAALSAPPSRRGWLAPLAGAVAVALVAWFAWPRTQAPVPAPIATTPIAPTPTVAPEAIEEPVAPAELPLVESPGTPIEDEAPADDPEWAALDDEDAEVYAWLADAPVAPDTGEDAL